MWPPNVVFSITFVIDIPYFNEDWTNTVIAIAVEISADAKPHE